VAIETIIWIYWLFCLIATILVIANREFAYNLLSPNSELSHKEKGYQLSVILGWVITLLVATGYVLLTRKNETGSYQIWDLLVFSFSNGVLEQFMFIFWFLLGCYIGNLYAKNNPKLIFISGYMSYAVFSGLVHAFFWVKVLPDHEPVTVLMALLLAAMSLIWMWLVWRYRAVLAIIAMHIVIDFIMVGHLHFPWFESFQIG
jgi:chlorophyllide a hydrolase